MGEKDINYSFKGISEKGSPRFLARETTFLQNRESWDIQPILKPSIDANFHPSEEQKTEEFYKTGVGTRSVEYALINPDGEGPLVIYNMGLGGDLNSPVARRERAVLSQDVAPNSPFLAINNPGSGKSSTLSHDVIKKMREDNSFEPYGNFLTDVIGDVIEDLQKGRGLEIWGHSIGANTALGLATAYFAENPENKTQTLRAINPLGTETHSLAEMYARFAVAEGVLQTRHYSKNSPFNELSKLQEQQIIAGMTNKTWLKNALAGFWQNGVALPQVAARATLATDLAKVFPAISDNLTIISPEFSEFGDAEKTRAILGNLAAQNSGGFIPNSGSARPEIVRQIQLNNHTLSFMSAGAGIAPLATAYKMAGEK